MAFTGMVFLQIYHVLLLAERAFTKKSRKLGRAFLEHHCERTLKLCDW